MRRACSFCQIFSVYKSYCFRNYRLYTRQTTPANGPDKLQVILQSSGSVFPLSLMLKTTMLKPHFSRSVFSISRSASVSSIIAFMFCGLTFIWALVQANAVSVGIRSCFSFIVFSLCPTDCSSSPNTFAKSLPLDAASLMNMLFFQASLSILFKIDYSIILRFDFQFAFTNFSALCTAKSIHTCFLHIVNFSCRHL